MTSLEPETQFRPSAAVLVATPRCTPLADPSGLIEAVRAAVRSVDEQALRPVASPDVGLAFQPKTLLAVTLYCYAHDIFGSEDIEDALRFPARGCCGASGG